MVPDLVVHLSAAVAPGNCGVGGDPVHVLLEQLPRSLDLPPLRYLEDPATRPRRLHLDAWHRHGTAHGGLDRRGLSLRRRVLPRAALHRGRALVLGIEVT